MCTLYGEYLNLQQSCYLSFFSRLRAFPLAFSSSRAMMYCIALSCARAFGRSGPFRQIVYIRACTCTCCMRVCVGVCAKPPRTCFSVCRWHCRVACRPVQPWRQLATAPGDAASPPSTLQPPQHTAISEAVCVFLSFSVTCSLACALCLCLCLPSSLCFYLSVACRFYFGVCLYPCVSMSTPECSS
jgi:hypothetical protein